jgi:hypothetical protein
MDIVQRFKNGIAWYQPTTDTYSWKYFYDQCYSVDYTQATGETLKKVAWWSSKLQPGEDVGMWADRKARLLKFLNSDIGDSDYDPLFSKAIQYEFVACFLNNYSRASHNKDLWQSINDSATKVLNEQIVPSDQSALASYQPVHDYAPLVPNPRWLLAAIPMIIYSAFKTVNLSYYRPTVDTGTWSYFQNVVFELDILNRFQITYRHTYLLSNISSSVDSGMWGTLASASSAFLDANLGKPPANAQSQVDLAINFCQLFQFNYSHAAHNADLFKTYNDAFSAAVVKLQLLLQLSKQAPKYS